MDKFFGGLRRIGIRRRTRDKWIGGVCSGLADRLGVDPVVVRAGFVLLTLLGGAGVTIYLVAWALLPNDRDEIPPHRALRAGYVGPIVLLVLVGFALSVGSAFGGPCSVRQSGLVFPSEPAPRGLCPHPRDITPQPGPYVRPRRHHPRGRTAQAIGTTGPRYW